MKNFTLLIALFFSLAVTAQDHPGKRPELLIGKEVTVKELPVESREFGYHNFYQNEKLTNTYEDIGNSRTRHEALANKTFTVISVEPAVNLIGKPIHIIKLQAADGTEVFFQYAYNYNYYFQVKGGLEYPADFYCDYITVAHSDKGTEIYNIQPYLAIMLSKIKLDGKASYFLYLSTKQAEIDLTAGVIITLENGAKIIKPNLEAEVKPFVGTVSGYEYSVNVPLTDKDIQQLKAHKITGYQIAKFKETPGRTEEIKNALPCLMTK